jgi:hypothetical protein
MQTETHLDDLVTVKTMAARYPELGTESALRFQIFESASNGLEAAGAIVRNGRRILIDLPRYKNWVLRGRDTRLDPASWKENA